MHIFSPEQYNGILHNRGCGISYIQRNHKIPFSAVPSDSWFFQENLCDKIAIDVPWCLIEPREGEFNWNHPEWEGCFNSWIDNGYKVHLKVRGMDTLGTLYDQGTPQWVFDAGAKYIDEPIEFYRNTWLLNNIPFDREQPIRYPLYWDEIYLEKTDALIAELGERYNGNPAVESVSISHVGRWGEMHVADHYKPEIWVEHGFTVERYNQALIRTINSYRRAFPDKQLSLSLGRPIYIDGITVKDAWPAIDHAVANSVMLKFDGLGHSYEFGSGPYICKNIHDTLMRHCDKTKIMFENLILPEALDFGLRQGLSYWHAGGEPPAMTAITNVERDIPLPEKRIYSFYKFFKNQYDRMTRKDEKNIWRNMALKSGYRLVPSQVRVSGLSDGSQEMLTEFTWWNLGCAPCFEQFEIVLRLVRDDKILWEAQQAPGIGCSNLAWKPLTNINDHLLWQIPQSLASGTYELQLGVKMPFFNNAMMQLGIYGRRNDGFHSLGAIEISN